MAGKKTTNLNMNKWDEKDSLKPFRVELNDNLDKIDSTIGILSTEIADKVEKGYVDEQVETINTELSGAVKQTIFDAEVGTLTAQLADTAKNINQRGINVLNPPIPFVACVGDGIINDTNALNALQVYAQQQKVPLNIPETPSGYYLTNFIGLDNVDIVGIGLAQLKIEYIEGVSTKPLVDFGNNSEYKSLWINCITKSLEWNRGNLTGKKYVTIDSCKIEGFRHPVAAPNAWGLYLDKSEHITIKNTLFENNTQSDIAIVEGCKHITIDNVSGSNLHINFEPNTASPQIESIVVSNSKIKLLSLLELQFNGNSARNLYIDTCTIDEVFYYGLNAEFNNSVIKNMRQSTLRTVWFAGNLKLGGAFSLGQNIVKDPHLDYLSYNGDSYWVVASSYKATNDESFLRVDTPYGKLTRINPTQGNGMVALKTKGKITVEANSPYLITVNSKASYPLANASFISRQVDVRVYDATDTLIKTFELSINRSAPGTDSSFNDESALVLTPATASYIVILLRNSTTNSTASVDFGSIEIRKVIFGGNSASVVDLTYKQRPRREFFGTQVPSLTYQYARYDVGDKMNIEIPIAGGYLGRICVTSGNPGTWKGFGLIEA